MDQVWAKCYGIPNIALAFPIPVNVALGKSLGFPIYKMKELAPQDLPSLTMPWIYMVLSQVPKKSQSFG